MDNPIELTQSAAPHASSPRASLERHQRCCAICNHPNLDAIEEDFLRWHNPWRIIEEYRLPSRSSLYRHVHATGLLEKRNQNTRGVLERYLEHVERAPVTANGIIRALELYSRMSPDGRIIAPAKRVIYTYEHLRAKAPASVGPKRFLPGTRKQAHRVSNGSKKRR